MFKLFLFMLVLFFMLSPSSLFVLFVTSTSSALQWDTVISNVSFMNPCFRSHSLALDYDNPLIHSRASCAVTIDNVGPDIHHCFGYLYPIRTQRNGEVFKYDECLLQMSSSASSSSKHSMSILTSFQQLSSQDGTMVFLFVELFRVTTINTIDMVIVDTNYNAVQRNNQLILNSIKPLSMNMGRMELNQRLGRLSDDSEDNLVDIQKPTPYRVLFVCNPNCQPYESCCPRHISSESTDCSSKLLLFSDMILFQRWFPFLACHDSSKFEVHIFAPFGIATNSSGDERIYLSHLNVRDEGVSLNALLFRGWIPNIDYLKAGSWHPKTQHEVSYANQEAINDAMRLIRFFQGYDAIIYDTVEWALPSQISLLANFMWLAETPRLIRYVTSEDSFHEQFGYGFPSHAVVVDSTAYFSEHWFELEIASQLYPGSLQNSLAKMFVIPPFITSSIAGHPHVSTLKEDPLDDGFVVGFFARMSNPQAPGAFLRMAAKIRQLCRSNDTNGESICHVNGIPSTACSPLCPSQPIRFVMLAHGPLLSSMRAMVRLLELSSVATIISVPQSPSSERVARMMSQCTVLVDPSPTHAGHVPLYPTAAALGIPIVRFKSSSAFEWLVDGQPVINVEVGTVEGLAFACLNYLQRVNVGAKRTFYRSPALLNIVENGFGAIATAKVAESILTHILRSNVDPQGIPKLEPPHNGSWLPELRSDAVYVDEASYHHSWLRGSSHTMDLAAVTLNDELLDRCNAWDRYGVLQTMIPRLALQFDAQSDNPSHNSAGARKLLCLIFTVQSRHNQVRSQLMTWGKRCDGFIAFSNVDDPTINAVNLDTEFHEAYTTMWLKMTFTYRCQILGTPMENMVYDGLTMNWVRQYLSLYEANGTYTRTPLYFGRTLLRGYQGLYNNGGAGYVLNAMSVRLLVEEIYSENPCFDGYLVAMEDVLVARCLARRGVFPEDTRDYSQSIDGMERFHWFSPTEEFEAIEPAYRRHHNIYQQLVSGFDCCSPQSISFHPLSPDEMICADLLWFL